MELQALTERIGSLIGKDDLKTAIKEMSHLLKNSNKLDEVILQSARFNDLSQQIRLGTILTENATVSKNQIRFALLDLLRDVEQNATADPSIRAEVEAVNFPTTQINIKQNHTGSGDNIGGDKIITNN